MTKPLTQEKFDQKVFDATNGEIRCIEKYKGCKAKHWWEHTPCGHQFPAMPDNIYHEKYNCPRCRENGYTFTMVDGHVQKLVKVRCEKMHRFRLLIEKIPAYHEGKIKCPICKRLAVLDPIYKDSVVDFSFEMRGGFLL